MEKRMIGDRGWDEGVDDLGRIGREGFVCDEAIPNKNYGDKHQITLCIIYMRLSSFTPN